MKRALHDASGTKTHPPALMTDPPHIPSASVFAGLRLGAVQRFTSLASRALLVEGDLPGAARAEHPAVSRCVLALST